MTQSTDHPFADGFLSDAIREVRAEVRNRYPSFVDLLLSTNRRAVSLQHELEIDLGELHEALGAALFARTLAFTQSSVLLLEHGMPVQARTLLRAGMETLFQLAALAKEPKIAPSLIASRDADRRTLVDRVRRCRDPLLRTSIESNLTQVDISELATAAGKPINIYELAKMADMEDWYLTVYTLLSFAAHSKVSDLDRHVVVDDDGEVLEFQNEPITADQESMWAWVVEVQLAAMRSVADLFSIEVEELATLSNRLVAVSAEHGAA